MPRRPRTAALTPTSNDSQQCNDGGCLILFFDPSFFDSYSSLNFFFPMPELQLGGGGRVIPAVTILLFLG